MSILTICFQAVKRSMRMSEGLSSWGVVFFLMRDWERDTVEAPPRELREVVRERVSKCDMVPDAEGGWGVGGGRGCADEAGSIYKGGRGRGGGGGGRRRSAEEQRGEQRSAAHDADAAAGGPAPAAGVIRHVRRRPAPPLHWRAHA